MSTIFYSITLAVCFVLWHEQQMRDRTTSRFKVFFYLGLFVVVSLGLFITLVLAPFIICTVIGYLLWLRQRSGKGTPTRRAIDGD